MYLRVWPSILDRPQAIQILDEVLVTSNRDCHDLLIS